MNMLSTPFPLAGCAFAGVASHLFYFIRGDHHLQAASFVKLGVAALFSISSIIFFLQHTSLKEALKIALSMEASYITTLFMSILIYRLLFHPLRPFPGPLSMRASKLVHSWRSRRLDNYVRLEELHKTYGDFVRTGPNELTIFRPSAFTELNGVNSKCTKAAWYDMLMPNISLQSSRSKTFHDQRRRVWDHAFSVKALASYEHRVMRHIEQLERTMEQQLGKVVEMTQQLLFFGFDVMGDVAFGAQLNCQRTGKTHFAVDNMRSGMRAFGLLTPVPWLFHLAITIPGAMSAWYSLVNWAHGEVTRRLKTKPENPDIYHWLLDFTQKTSTMEKEMPYLYGDSVLSVVAGSETTSTALAFIFYHLAQNPSQVEKIRNELKTVENIRSHQQLQSLPHLNAIITETMRLHPPVVAGLQRNTPNEGVIIDGQPIPGNVTCLAPIYSIARLESCFEQAETFIPERWTTTPQLTKNRAAYAPFGNGSYGCVGKSLALMEMRLVTAILISRFDVAFAPGETGKAIVEELHDTFTAAPGPLRLVFTEREKF